MLKLPIKSVQLGNGAECSGILRTLYSKISISLMHLLNRGTNLLGKMEDLFNNLKVYRRFVAFLQM